MLQNAQAGLNQAKGFGQDAWGDLKDFGKDTTADAKDAWGKLGSFIN